MNVFISWTASLDRDIELAVRADDPDTMRRHAQTLERANKIWKSWAESIGGSIVILEGSSGTAQVPASRLDEVPAVHSTYESALGAETKAFVGIGTKLTEADRALMLAKQRGHSKVVLYTQEVDEELAQIEKEQAESTAMQKAAPALAQGAGNAGMSGPSKGQPQAPAAPKVEASEHSQGEAMRHMMEFSNPGVAPAAPPEQSQASMDIEDILHDHAQKQGLADSQQNQQAAEHDQIRQQVVQVLQQIKAAAPIIESIKEQSPETYQAMMGMVQAMIAMAQHMQKEEQKVQKSEEDISLYKSANTFHAAFANQEGEVKIAGPFHDPSVIPDDWQNPIEGFVDNSGKFYTREQAVATLGQARAMHDEVAKEELSEVEENPEEAPKADADLEKVAAHHHVVLPVGSQKDSGANGVRSNSGKIKVEHEDGKQGWIQARAGQTLSLDGHPISARNKSGK